MAAEKNGKTVKMVLAIVAALGISGTGIAGFYTLQGKLQADNEWACKTLTELKARHDADINALRLTLDTLSRNSTTNTAKLDILVEMVREVKAEVKK